MLESPVAGFPVGTTATSAAADVRTVAASIPDTDTILSAVAVRSAVMSATTFVPLPFVYRNSIVVLVAYAAVPYTSDAVIRSTTIAVPAAGAATSVTGVPLSVRTDAFGIDTVASVRSPPVERLKDVAMIFVAESVWVVSSYAKSGSVCMTPPFPPYMISEKFTGAIWAVVLRIRKWGDYSSPRFG